VTEYPGIKGLEPLRGLPNLVCQVFKDRKEDSRQRRGRPLARPPVLPRAACFVRKALCPRRGAAGLRRPKGGRGPAPQRGAAPGLQP
jgi:hypothetical protein